MANRQCVDDFRWKSIRKMKVLLFASTKDNQESLFIALTIVVEDANFREIILLDAASSFECFYKIQVSVNQESFHFGPPSSIWWASLYVDAIEKTPGSKKIAQEDALFEQKILLNLQTCYTIIMNCCFIWCPQSKNSSDGEWWWGQ